MHLAGKLDLQNRQDINCVTDIFENNFDLAKVIAETREKGYAFVALATRSNICKAMANEALSLPLEFGDHRRYPLNKGTTFQVEQTHSRSYHILDDPETPVANEVCKKLAIAVRAHAGIYPELTKWIPTEIGYQQYQADRADWISPHRDRKSDQLLSITFTLTGSALVKIYEAKTDPPDYEKIEIIDEFLTNSATVMFLRAPGFGSGKQVIHEVCPPITDTRLILNLRMRESILKQPSQYI